MTLASSDQAASNSNQFNIQDNLVMSNTATSNGGGLSFSAQACQGAFDRNRVIGNRAGASNGGGSITLFSSSTTFYGNEFRRMWRRPCWWAAVSLQINSPDG
jgi:hypothetical protein